MVRISTPAIVCALSIASLIDRTVQSMLATIPLRRPRQGTIPAPRIVIPSAPSTSATTAQTLVVPMSRPTTISPCEGAVLISSSDRMARGGGPNLRQRDLAHPDDDALGARVVVEHDGFGLGAAGVEFGDDASGLLQLATKGRTAQDELESTLSDDEREGAVRFEVDLFEREALGERPALVFRSQVDGAPYHANRSLVVFGESLWAQARDERQVDGIGRFELLEGLTVCAREKHVADGDEGDRPALGHLHQDGPGQTAGERDLRDPRVREDATAGRVEVRGEDIGADDEPALRDDIRRGAPLVADDVDLRDGETRAGHDVPTGGPREPDRGARDESDPRHRAEHREGLAPAARRTNLVHRCPRRRHGGAVLIGERGEVLDATVAGGHGEAPSERIARSSRPHALMSPAPRAMTRSPGSMMSSSARATRFLSGTNDTARWPWARIASARASPVAPSMGFSPAA